MRLFSVSEAKHYTSFLGGSVGDSERSLSEFHKKHVQANGIRVLSEGSAIFDEYRDCLLRNVERALFFSASNYRRALDLMTCSASPWSHVTMYYGSWHAAHALLGLFGCAIVNHRVVDVARGLPGNQALRIRGIGNRQGEEHTTCRGSHEKFWDFFYRAFGAARPVFPSRFWVAISPMLGDPLWQIAMRNDINYDLYSSTMLAQNFDQTFACGRFPACLPSVMNTQYRVLDLLLEMSFHYAREFGITTDGLDGVRGHSPLRAKVRQLIFNERASDLVSRTRKSIVT